MTIKSTFPFFVISLITFIIHLVLMASVLEIDISSLICFIHIFLFCWLTLHIFIIHKVHQRNKTQVIPVFLILSALKMFFVVVVIVVLKKILIIDSLQIILHFFTAYFVYLILQVAYSKKLLQ